MAEKWTNTSAVPSSGAMKPKPLSALNHFTVPVAISSSPLSAMPGATSPRRPRAYRVLAPDRTPAPVMVFRGASWPVMTFCTVPPGQSGPRRWRPAAGGTMGENTVEVTREAVVRAAPQHAWLLVSDSAAWSLRPGEFRVRRAAGDRGGAALVLCRPARHGPDLLGAGGARTGTRAGRRSQRAGPAAGSAALPDALPGGARAQAGAELMVWTGSQ